MRPLVLILLLMSTAVRAEAVRVPGPEGILLNAELFAAQGKGRGSAIVALHGCGGPLASRDEAWAKLLAASGHTVLLPDSFGSRGLGSQCTSRSHPVTATGVRRHDALAVLAWLAARPGTPAGGLVLMGWADGGTTALTAGRALPDVPPGLIRGLVAFYPSCRTAADTKDWAPAAPLLILMGQTEDAAEPCRTLADRLPGKVTLVVYPGTNRDFDVAGQRAPARGRLLRPAGAVAHGGGDSSAQEESMRRVAAFLAALP